MGEFFDLGLEELQENLPDWWAQRDESSELYKLLAVFGGLADELAAEAEGIYADMAVETARDVALHSEWAVLYGAGNEQLPTTAETLRAYLQQRANDDGSVDALRRALLALLVPPNTVGDPLRFPADGTGLHFPADGSGIHFPHSGLKIMEHPNTHQIEVQVEGSFSFDRPAFARAVNRFRLADDLPPVVTEI